MKDIFEATIVCEKCHKRAEKGRLVKDGFEIRALKCPSCGETWLHPADMKDYERFMEMKRKQFQVKLRMVGNSFAVSIPREIIEFEKVRHDEIVSVSMDSPNRVTLFFSKTSKTLLRKKPGDDNHGKGQQ